MKLLSIAGLALATMTFTMTYADGTKDLTTSRPGVYISGKTLKVIEAALPEATKRKLDLDLYKISVSEDKTTVDGKPNDHYVVSFIDANAPWPPTGVGNPGKIPGLEVKVAKDRVKVLGAAFIR